MSRQFGEKLRHLRLQRGMTQTELAHQLQLSSHSHITNLESGRRAPSLDLVLRLADIFHVTTDYLLRNEVPTERVAQRTITPAISPGEDPPKRFGAKLRYLRIQRNLTQAELTNSLQLRTQAHISLLESTRSEPSIAFAIQLADFFGVTVDYLLWDAIAVEDQPGNA
jgi:transcriptional regulator with XRE-family HTH domain